MIHLYVLTTVASTFFLCYRYRVVERGEAPEVIRGTTQFAELRPASATFMSKMLQPRLPILPQFTELRDQSSSLRPIRFPLPALHLFPREQRFVEPIRGLPSRV